MRRRMTPRHFWKEARRYFAEDVKYVDLDFGEMEFLKYKFCLFVDLISFKHYMYHGNGLKVMNTKDGVQLEIRRKNTSGADHDNRILAQIYVLADAQVSLENNRLNSILF